VIANLSQKLAFFSQTISIMPMIEMVPPIKLDETFCDGGRY